MKKIVLISILFFVAQFCRAQEPITSVVDTTQIKIGAPLEFTIKAATTKGTSVVFPNQPEFGDFEVIEQKPIDTILKNQQMELVKKYTLTKFDSGAYTIPRLSVFIDNKNYQTQFHKIQVSDVVVDTLKQPMYDIKPVFDADASITAKTYRAYFWALFIVILLGVLVYLLIRWYQKKTLTEEDLYRTPLEKAKAQLVKLDANNWIQEGNVKDYYSELSDIIREYIEEVFDIPAKESTTRELLSLLIKHIKKQKVKLSKETIKQLQNLLETADLVKFAKVQPQYFEIETNRKEAYQVADDVNIAIPKFSEEQSEKVRLRELRYKRRKRVRVWLPILTVFVGMLTIGGYYLIQRFQDIQVDWFQTNKSLYEQQWASEDYGYPALSLTTPEVLQRKDLAIYKDKKAPQMGIFSYENTKTKLFIFAQTVNTPSTDSDIEELLKNKLRYMEQTLLFTQLNQQSKKFEQQGVDAIQSTGTYQISVDDKPIKMAFELLVFSQKVGTQTVWISYPAGDEYGEKIAQRVIEHIHLNVVQTEEDDE